MAVTALEAAQVRRRLDPAALPFQTTAEVPPLHGTIGQERALDAIDFGLEVPTPGYNLFVAGAAGSGRESTIVDHLERVAATRPAPDDLVYAHNFAEPERPRALCLPAGRGRALRRDLDELLARAREDIPRAFEGEEFEARRQQALAEVQRRQEQINDELQRAARERGFQIQQTPTGLASVPVRGGQPLSGEELQRLSPEEMAELQRRADELNELVGGSMRQLRRLGQEVGERTRAMARDVARAAIGPRLEELRERWADQPEVLALLGDIERDVPERLPDFRPVEAGEGGPPQVAQAQAMQREQHLGRYGVNVVVDHGDDEHAPVVLERNPTYYNLIGRVDYRASFGAVETDFRQIRAGALHRARGGFLVLHALDVMRQPFAWEALKRALLDREVRIENLAEQSSPIPTATLRPEPVPLDVKVVLIGPPSLYHLLYEQDEDFRDVFKVKADFAPDMEWTDEHVSNYAAFISRCVQTAGLHHFDRSAVARIVEHGSRLREHQSKLSSRLRDISDVVSEASFWAGRAGRDVVSAEDVDRAVAEREYRSNLPEERVHELIAEGTIAIDTTGARTAQINGLSTFDLGDHRFGRPSRVTARVSVGTGGVKSIEREIARSGPIHSKGVLTLAGYMAQTYAQRWPLALRATIAFEQAYEGIDGDSASSTELYALLSALADLPIRQGIAVTGSVDQHGRVQAVGGVTAKVEAFFAVCRARGLSGEQGVMIPRANVRHLMLADEVVAAVAAGEFHVWAVAAVDEGIELLTGCPAGERGADGEFPAGTVHRRVEDRLRGYADRLRDFTVSPDGARSSAGARHRVSAPARSAVAAAGERPGRARAGAGEPPPAPNPDDDPRPGGSGAMAERWRAFIRGVPARSLLPAVLLLVPALAVWSILIGAISGADRPSAAAAEQSGRSSGADGGRRGASTITIGWVGDITPGSQYGLPGAGGAALFADVRDTLRAPDLMAGNLEGTLSTGGVSKCGAGAVNCYAFQAPPSNALALGQAGLDIVNLANNHAFDYGDSGRMQTLGALTAAKVAFTGLPGDVRVLTRRGVRVAFVGFSTYRWTPSMDDAQAVRALIDQAAAIADVVVVFFHAGAEGSDRTGVPIGRESAFGEDRGDSRAFAHFAIDAGADLVLGSGPHVIRGMETYRGRLIAYSLGNFAGVHNFASGGTLSVSGVLTVRVDRRGRLRNGWWHGIALDASGTPHPDQGVSRSLVAQLSARDFGAAAPRLLATGRILPPDGPRR